MNIKGSFERLFLHSFIREEKDKCFHSNCNIFIRFPGIALLILYQPANNDFWSGEIGLPFYVQPYKRVRFPQMCLQYKQSINGFCLPE
ncbi:hypothetical protein CEXT_801301 [Caerostris extrusa]|uniref:Ycf15 n=1 Tax=Caerostris extrusa TaxID=172846 RepID=A0AAV4VUK2_CAEEX|nr:hypothetical protein CEXT_801301 [Caerostris extrusa]